MKLIRYKEAKDEKKEFMKFVASTVYQHKALIKEKEDQLFLLEKMVEYEESEVERQDFSQRHHIECYILILLSRLCEVDARNFHRLGEIMEAKGYSQDRFEKLVRKLVENIRPAIAVKDKQVWVGILMLLSVIVVNSERKKELFNCLWDKLFIENQESNALFEFYYIITHADLFLAQARHEFITDPDELS